MLIHSSTKAVFAAVTDAKKLTRWFPDKAALSPHKGGSYAFEWIDGPTHTGKVLEFSPGRSVTLTWQWPGKERLGLTKLKISVDRKAGAALLRFTHSGFGTGRVWSELYEGAIRGWTYYMMNLKSVLETGRDLRSPEDW